MSSAARWIAWRRCSGKTPDGSFPVADRLIETMRINGFDGYFINQETVGGDANTAQRMQAFMRYFQREAGPGKELIWYDAMTESGEVRWQERLNDRNDGFFQDGEEPLAEKMFLDFGWRKADLEATRAKARELARSEYDLYAAVNVEDRGYVQRVNWPAVFPEGQPHRASLALFVPTWTWNRAPGATPRQRVAEYRARESRLWVGAEGDPSDTEQAIGRGNWRGVAHFIPAKTAVVGDEFATNFNLGQGSRFFLEGEVASRSGWTNMSLQDLLPTWRWVVDTESRAPLHVGFDTRDAYYGGGCLRVEGAIDAPALVPLYATQLDLHADSRLAVTFKTGVANRPSGAELVFAFAEEPTDFVVAYDLGAANSDSWETASFDLGEHAGKVVSRIGIRFAASAEQPHDVRFGRLAVTRAESDPPAPPKNLRLLSPASRGGETVTLRLAWDPSPGAVRSYHVMRIDADGKRTFLDGSTGTVCFARCNGLRAEDQSIEVEVEAVDPRFGVSEPVRLTCPLPPM